MKVTDEHKYALWVTDAISSLFDAENENYKGKKLEEIDLTAFFTGFFMAFGAVYDRLTDQHSDLVDIVALANRLSMQYITRDKAGESE